MKVPPEQIAVVFAAIVGDAVTVIARVTVHPLLSLYVIVAGPGATPSTTPPLVMVATAVFDEVQGVVALGVPLPVKVIVLVGPTQRVFGPVMVGAPGDTMLKHSVNVAPHDAIEVVCPVITI